MRSIFQSKPDESPPGVEPVPTVFPEIEGAQIAAAFVGKRVAGDFYDSLRVSSERILFGLLDVAGRREQNRGILAVAQHIFRRAGAELFSQLDINESDAMTQLCLALNRGLIEDSRNVRACPAFIGCYHEKFGTLCYTNAGHTAALLRGQEGITELRATGLPLGLFSHATCDSPTVGLAAGAALLVVSRGVVECSLDHGGSEQEFGISRIQQLLLEAGSQSAQELCSSILSASGAFRAQAVQCEDLTALALLRIG